MYRLQKLYADLVAEDGTVCIVYLAKTTFLGMRRSCAWIEWYDPDGHQEVIEAHVPEEGALTEVHDAALTLYLDVQGRPFVLDFDVTDGTWTPAPPAPGDGLAWSVVTARAQGTARWLGTPFRPPLHGLGYADWLDLRHLPRRLNLERLDWGRIHGAQETLVYSVLRFRAAAPWMRIARWSQGAFVDSARQFELTDMDGMLRLDVLDRPLVLKPERVLHEGPAITVTRFPGMSERIISRAVAGPIAESRWLSRAFSEATPRVYHGRALHERVLFGRHERDITAEPEPVSRRADVPADRTITASA